MLNGAKYFSQYDEDGIIDDILSRLSYKSSPRFLEIGVGGGLEIENNTINLLSMDQVEFGSRHQSEM